MHCIKHGELSHFLSSFSCHAVLCPSLSPITPICENGDRRGHVQGRGEWGYWREGGEQERVNGVQREDRGEEGKWERVAAPPISSYWGRRPWSDELWPTREVKWRHWTEHKTTPPCWRYYLKVSWMRKSDYSYVNVIRRSCIFQMVYNFQRNSLQAYFTRPCAQVYHVTLLQNNTPPSPTDTWHAAVKTRRTSLTVISYTWLVYMTIFA